MALDLLIGTVQAYIFTVLAMVFIGSAAQREDRRRQQAKGDIMN